MQLPSSKTNGTQPGSNARRRGLLSRLAKDKRGNVLMIAGAAAIPVMMMAGAALDFGRAAMVRNQMQDACDSTALNLRKRISANGNVMSPELQQEAARYFEGALGDNIQGARKEALDISWNKQNNRSYVQINANYAMSGTLLKIVTQNDLKISVSCEAEHNLYNYDILFVLDVTNSMNCLPDETCPGGTLAGSKINILKNVVKKFVVDMAPVQDEMKRQNLVLRYAVLPFSNAVNMKNLFTGSLDRYFYIAKSKKVKAYNGIMVDVPGNYSMFNFSDTELSYPATDSRVNNRLESWDLPGTTDTAAPNWSGCIVERKTKKITSSTDTVGALDMDIDRVPESGNLETYWHPYIGTNTRSNTGTALNLTEYCPPPAIGFREITQNTATGSPNWSGTTAISRGDFNNYIDSLTATGGTMTDMAMNWAARMTSPGGIFASSPNTNPDNGIPVQKIIILITDGYIAPPPHIYTAYGFAGTPSNTNGVLRVISGPLQWNPEPVKTHDINWKAQAEMRLGITCNELIKRNTSIWVIGFGAGMSDIRNNKNLSGCANPTDQIAEATTESGLNSIMDKISGRIGGLRITK